MDRWVTYPVEVTEMSPGLDNWRLEACCSSSLRGLMHPCRNWSYNADHTSGQRKGLPEEGKNTRGHCPLERVGKVGESLATDRVKAMRSFKFALVEYVKDLLRPYWKDGKISRDAHKIIVKKSVNKVIESLGTMQIPLGRNIDNYLKSSHLKLSKLVQAYVEKYKKG